LRSKIRDVARGTGSNTGRLDGEPLQEAALTVTFDAQRRGPFESHVELPGGLSLALFVQSAGIYYRYPRALRADNLYPAKDGSPVPAG